MPLSQMLPSSEKEVHDQGGSELPSMDHYLVASRASVDERGTSMS